MLLPAPVTEEATLEPLHQEILDWLQARACFCNFCRSSLLTHSFQHLFFTLCRHLALHFRSLWQISVTGLRCICTLIFSSSSSFHGACPPLFATFLFAFLLTRIFIPLFFCHTNLLLNSLTFPFHCVDETFPVVQLTKQVSPLTLHISMLFQGHFACLLLLFQVLDLEITAFLERRLNTKDKTFLEVQFSLAALIFLWSTLEWDTRNQ